MAEITAQNIEETAKLSKKLDKKIAEAKAIAEEINKQNVLSVTVEVKTETAKQS